MKRAGYSCVCNGLLQSAMDCTLCGAVKGRGRPQVGTAEGALVVLFEASRAPVARKSEFLLRFRGHASSFGSFPSKVSSMAFFGMKDAHLESGSKSLLTRSNFPIKKVGFKEEQHHNWA